jgi:hypothetical protein
MATDIWSALGYACEMKRFLNPLQILSLAVFTLFPVLLWASDIDRFAGTYSGRSDTVLDGESQGRDLKTTISLTDDGFNISWTSITFKLDETPRAKTYEIEFVPSQRDNIYGSAMKTNMFGKQVPLDPLQGEPFVWSRFDDDTLSVFSLFINEVGEYEMQEFHRTLQDGGLDLLFRRVSNGVPQKEINAFLARQ